MAMSLTQEQKLLIQKLKFTGCNEEETVATMLFMDAPRKVKQLLKYLEDNRKATSQDALRKALEIA